MSLGTRCAVVFCPFCLQVAGRVQNATKRGGKFADGRARWTRPDAFLTRPDSCSFREWKGQRRPDRCLNGACLHVQASSGWRTEPCASRARIRGGARWLACQPASPIMHAKHIPSKKAPKEGQVIPGPQFHLRVNFSFLLISDLRKLLLYRKLTTLGCLGWAVRDERPRADSILVHGGTVLRVIRFGAQFGMHGTRMKHGAMDGQITVQCFCWCSYIIQIRILSVTLCTQTSGLEGQGPSTPQAA
jgi:hypothetical protein